MNKTACARTPHFRHVQHLRNAGHDQQGPIRWTTVFAIGSAFDSTALHLTTNGQKVEQRRAAVPQQVQEFQLRGLNSVLSAASILCRLPLSIKMDAARR